MPFIQVKLIGGVFTALQKQEIVERLTDAMVEIEGENMRQVTWCVIEEVASGDWGIGGQTPTAPEAFRDAVIAVDLLGLSYREAARSLHTREATITTRLHRGREHIAHALTNQTTSAP